MEDMVCPRCGTPLQVERVNGIIEITCHTCNYCSDVATNVRDAQKEFFETIFIAEKLRRLNDVGRRVYHSIEKQGE